MIKNYFSIQILEMILLNSVMMKKKINKDVEKEEKEENEESKKLFKIR